ncbi:MAG: isoprenylcysteine carboxylmethyltransferase family protein [Phenylobacterium sp.]|nr:MAG: isoprenylcysteine carboxylmethyltransferase family protein [Phenylobacterium sp.]
MLVVMAAVLFGGAGTWDWPGGWAFISLFGLLSVVISLWLLAVDPALLAERMKPPVRQGQKPWDRIFLLVIGVGFLGWLALIGVDARRMGWSHLPPAGQAVGAGLMVLSYLGIAWVYRTNSFASPVIRLQAERHQTVASTGPYAFVRHPMYAFALLIFVGAPLLAGSLWGLTVVPLAAIAIGVRAVGEERMLKAELPGYEAYARRIRWRFAPGVW